MEERQYAEAIKDFEGKADTMIHAMQDICEQGLAKTKTAPAPAPEKALAAAALSVQESVKTFLAVTRVRE